MGKKKPIYGDWSDLYGNSHHGECFADDFVRDSGRNWRALKRNIKWRLIRGWVFDGVLPQREHDVLSGMQELTELSERSHVHRHLVPRYRIAGAYAGHHDRRVSGQICQGTMSSGRHGLYVKVSRLVDALSATDIRNLKGLAGHKRRATLKRIALGRDSI